MFVVNLFLFLYLPSEVNKQKGLTQRRKDRRVSFSSFSSRSVCLCERLEGLLSYDLVPLICFVAYVLTSAIDFQSAALARMPR